MTFHPNRFFYFLCLHFSLARIQCIFLTIQQAKNTLGWAVQWLIIVIANRRLFHWSGYPELGLLEPEHWYRTRGSQCAMHSQHKHRCTCMRPQGRGTTSVKAAYMCTVGHKGLKEVDIVCELTCLLNARCLALMLINCFNYLGQVCTSGVLTFSLQAWARVFIQML